MAATAKERCKTNYVEQCCDDSTALSAGYVPRTTSRTASSPDLRQRSSWQPPCRSPIGCVYVAHRIVLGSAHLPTVVLNLHASL